MELGAVPSRLWSDAALRALPWAVRVRLQRDIAAGAKSVAVDSDLLHATLRYVPEPDIRREVSRAAARNTSNTLTHGLAHCADLMQMDSAHA